MDSESTPGDRQGNAALAPPSSLSLEALAMAKAGEFGNAGLRAMSDLYARVKR